jgi:hypothetical protein
MHQMCISINQDSSAMLRPKKLEIKEEKKWKNLKIQKIKQIAMKLN